MELLLESVVRIGFWPTIIMLFAWGGFRLYGKVIDYRQRRAEAEFRLEEHQSDMLRLVISQSGQDRQRFDAVITVKIDVVKAAVDEVKAAVAEGNAMLRELKALLEEILLAVLTNNRGDSK